jgi:hypothetical protein
LVDIKTVRVARMVKVFECMVFFLSFWRY